VLATVRTPNPVVWWLIAGALAGLSLALYVPALQSVFLFAPLSRSDWLIAALAGSGYTFAPDLADAIGNPKYAAWIKLGSGLLGVIAFAIKAGEKNDHGEAIAEKLRAEGYLVTKMEPAAPPTPPAP
jgi:hypothetical protein